jgi:short-subunit dehydrogenase
MAGVSNITPLAWTTLTTHSYIETNLTAPFAVSQACLPYMKLEDKKESQHHDNSDAGPVVIHVGSFRAEMSDPNQEGYASSKVC